MSQPKSNEGLIARLYGVKNSLVKAYPDADTWSIDYLRDNLATLKASLTTSKTPS